MSEWIKTTSLPLEATEQPAASGSSDALNPGTRLDDFEIVRVLGAGGFGIVYLALDLVLLRYVAIKEYMPVALAGRGIGATVSVRSASLAEPFAAGLESFFNEARMLAGFDHPALVKVLRFWKANGTAYMAMQYYPGQTLKEARRAMSTPPDEAWLRAFIEPLLGALEVLHREGVYHRDIAPDNILLLPDGRPVLLDFGSARRVLGDCTQSLTAVLKPNFAPVEQYADDAAMRQGPWTDLYALGATVHFMLTGQVPTPAVMRAVRDVLPALSLPGDTVFAGVSTEFLATIDWTLALAPDDRPQSVESMRQALCGEVMPPRPSPRNAIASCPPPLTATELASAQSTDFDPSVAVEDHIEIGSAPQPVAVGTASRPRRVGHAVLASLALTGLGTLAWGSWALSSPAVVAAPVVSAAVNAAESTVVPSVIPVAPATSAASAPALKSSWALNSPAVVPAEAMSAAADAKSAVTPSVILAAPTSPAASAAASNVARPGVAVASKPLPTAARTDPSALRVDPKIARHHRQADAAVESRISANDAASQSPKAACGDRNFLALAMCVSRECRSPRWREHPQCVEARLAEEQRQRRMEQ